MTHNSQNSKEDQYVGYTILHEGPSMMMRWRQQMRDNENAQAQSTSQQNPKQPHHRQAS
jgi:hypothetical protein